MSNADDDRTAAVYQHSETTAPSGGASSAEEVPAAETRDSTTVFPASEPSVPGNPSEHDRPSDTLWRTGPAPTTTVVGLLVLVVAIIAGMYLGSDADVDLSLAAPVAAIVVGLGLIAVGLLSLGRRARRAEDAPTA